VCFSAARTHAEVAALPGLAGELDRRGGAVPVLRLPWPAAGSPPEGFATEVVLPLARGPGDAVAAALGELDAELLLALPGLVAVDVVTGGGVRRLALDGAPPRVRLSDGGTTTVW